MATVLLYVYLIEILGEAALTTAIVEDQHVSRWAVLAIPAFRLYWLARLIGTMAHQMRSVAVGWQVYALRHQVLDLGWVGLAEFLPIISLALITGQVADRFDRKMVPAACSVLQTLCAMALMILTMAGNTSETPIFIVILFNGVAQAFKAPAMSAFLPGLVPPRLFAHAVALSSSGFKVGVIIGPALGGLLFAVGASVLYGVCAGLLASTVIMTLMIKAARRETERKAVDVSTLLAGIRFIWSRPPILGAISLDLFAVLLGGATALLPVYAHDILITGPWGLGLLRSAPAVGALTMGFLLVWFPIKRQAGLIMFAAVTVFGLATIGFGLSASLWLSLALLVLMGAADMISVVIRQILVQVSTPDDMRGRVSAVNFVFIGTSNELGEFEFRRHRPLAGRGARRGAGRRGNAGGGRPLGLAFPAIAQDPAAGAGGADIAKWPADGRYFSVIIKVNSWLVSPCSEAGPA